VLFTTSELNHFRDEVPPCTLAIACAHDGKGFLYFLSLGWFKAMR